MKKSDYIKIFDSFLDNDISCGILLIGSIEYKDKLEVLEYLSLRLQVEFGKNVCLITNERIESELLTLSTKDDPHVEIPRLDCIFLCLLRNPYFKDSSWYTDIINQLVYYRKPFFGFTTVEQKTIFYEEE